jgi:heme/copper-type cytochrome/quinol oxidase subunit 1
VQLLATPVISITLLLVILERLFGIGLFDPDKSGDPVLYQHLFWMYSLLYSLIFIYLFTVGDLTGLVIGAAGTDIHVHDTQFIVAHFHFTMFGGTGFAFFAGLHYWWPKIFGVMYDF